MTPDEERRFGGLRRLYGDEGYGRLRALRVAVVGLGGVGSWAVEALARSGVAALVLIDLDHVAESNINRQVQATSLSLGMAKVDALAERVALIHPGCHLRRIDDFVSSANWPRLLDEPVDVLIDACDDSQAKLAMAADALRSRLPLVIVGAAGGKQRADAVAVDDLAAATHDPLLAALRRRLREQGAPRQNAIGLRCVFSREAVAPPAATCEGVGDGTLNCHGYGSSVMVTASFGMAAAGEALRQSLALSTPIGRAVRADIISGSTGWGC